MKYCPNCGSELSGRFCASCGFDSNSASTESAVDQKTEIVNNLYSVKATLSVLNSCVYNAIKKREKIESSITSERRLLDEALNNAEKQKNRVEVFEKYAAKYSEENLEKSQKEYTEKRNKELLIFWIPIVMIIVGVLIWAALIIFAKSSENFLYGPPPAVFMITPWVGVILIGLGIFFKTRVDFFDVLVSDPLEKE